MALMTGNSRDPLERLPDAGHVWVPPDHAAIDYDHDHEWEFKARMADCSKSVTEVRHG
jgi:hypothetical protein